MVHPVVIAFRALIGRADTPEYSAPLADALTAHGLAPYAFSRFSGAWRDALRPAVLQTLAQAHARASHFQRALAALGDIPALALKGVDYAQSLYGDAALRPMHDHDLLVPEADFARARAALERAGFREAVVQTGVARHPHHYAAQLVREGYGLDLHRAMRQGVRAEIDYPAIFAATTRRDDGVLIPSPHHRVLLHATHLAGHECIGPLVSFLDLEQMRPALDQQTHSLAQRWRVSHALAAALRLHALLCGDPLPRAFLGQRLLPSLSRLANAREDQPRGLQLARKLVLIDDWSHRVGFARYALSAVTERTPALRR